MPPRYINVDEQAQEGAIVFTIGGRKWYAAEPSLDVFKAVLAAAPDDTGKRDAGGNVVPPSREDTQASLDSMLPQLQLVLRAWDDEGNAPTSEEPDEAFLRTHLSVKRAGNILREVLGEGPGAAA